MRARGCVSGVDLYCGSIRAWLVTPGDTRACRGSCVCGKEDGCCGLCEVGGDGGDKGCLFCPAGVLALAFPDFFYPGLFYGRKGTGGSVL
jgi:hypothetical protein